MAGRAFTLSCTVATKQANTVLVSHGGTMLGYALHVREGRLTFSVRRVQGEDHEVALPGPLAEGPHAVVASLDKDGRLSLQVDGQAPVTTAGGGLIGRQPAEDFCVGHDAANPAARYVSPAPFQGTLTDLQVR